MGNIQGTHKFMSTLTGKLIRSGKNKFTPLPMPDDIIHQVNNLGDHEAIMFHSSQGIVNPQEWDGQQENNDDLYDPNEDPENQEENDIFHDAIEQNNWDPIPELVLEEPEPEEPKEPKEPEPEEQARNTP